MLNEKYQTLRISEEARQANAKIISSADLPKAPIRPRKAVNMALALVLGLALAVGLAAVVDRMDNRVHTDEDAENATGVPVLAYIPLIRNEAERYLARAGRRALPLLEGYRMLRTNLLFAAVDEPARMIAITSTEPGEGKTLSAVNLAVALALDNKKVILVDADLRHPTTHRFFDNPRDVGLSNVIAGEQVIESALQETQVPGLQLLAAGALPPNPPELLNSRAAHACFRQLRDLADFVIVDTSPALVMADAHVVTNLVDGIILVVSAGDVVKQQPLSRTADLLRQNGGRLLGIIMNKLQSGSSSYYGHYYAYSQDRYSKYYQRELSSGEDAES
jgi:receptor protein-tyrosine kinase